MASFEITEYDNDFFMLTKKEKWKITVEGLPPYSTQSFFMNKEDLQTLEEFLKDYANKR